MINRLFISLLFIIYGGIWTVSAQSVEQIKADKEHYLYGDGYGKTLKEADNAALSELTSKISINVQSDFTSEERESSQGENFSSGSDYNSVINTYSQATLNNTERIVINKEPDVHVFRYIRKSEIDRIFEGRKNKIMELTDIAETADEKDQVDDALRYYYWAYVLLKSMRYPNEVNYEDHAGDKRLLVTWLPTRINGILDNLAVACGKRNEEDDNVVEISFTYKGVPVKSIDYTYFDGLDWSNIYSARDGVGIIDLRPNSSDNIQIKYEYECHGEALIDNEISDVLKAVRGEIFRKAYASINIQNRVSPSARETGTEPVNTLAVNTVKSHNEIALASSSERSLSADQTADYIQIVKRICHAITQKDYISVKDCFTSEGFSVFTRLIGYGKARIVESSDLSFLSYGDEVYCRNILMNFSFANNNRKFVENVSITFNSQKKVDNIAFGLGKEATNDILKMDAWSRESQMVLINFLENYKTAYALKRWDYINSIFSDDALIITGKVVKKTLPGKEGMPLTNNRYVEFTRHNKADYMKKLRLTFQRNEYINIRFTNTDLTKMGKGKEMYGIQIKQDYFSSSYGDTGYLFLMVDLNQPKEPMIHIRTWQPERDPDFGIIGPGIF